MRCVADNSPLTLSDIRHKKPDGSEGDLCSDCRAAIYNIDEPDDREYQFQELTDGFSFLLNQK